MRGISLSGKDIWLSFHLEWTAPIKMHLRSRDVSDKEDQKEDFVTQGDKESQNFFRGNHLSFKGQNRSRIHVFRNMLFLFLIIIIIIAFLFAKSLKGTRTRSPLLIQVSMWC